MQRAAVSVAVILALSLSAPVLAAGHDETVFRLAVPDLFPERDDVDVGVDLVAIVFWRLPAGALAPGPAQERQVAPLPGPLEVTVRYHLQRACCAGQFVQGTRTLHDLTPLGELTLERLDLDVGRGLVLQLRGALRSALVAEGGAVAPDRLAWDAWDGQRVALAPDGGPGSEVELRARSTYALDVAAMLEEAAGVAQGTWQGEAPGDPVLRRTLPVEGGVPASKTVPAPAMLLALAMLGAALLLRRR